MKIKKVCVFCASSDVSHRAYLDAAYQLGEILAGKNIDILFGGGSAGSMGKIADGALSKGGKVYGVIPKFMYDLEWAHEGITELKIVNSLNERKQLLIEQADAVIALPGGSGTLEELFETITLKRLGIYLNPIILVNTRGFFNPCIELLEKSIEENFMSNKHREMWSVAANPFDVVDSIKKSPVWYSEARNFATLLKRNDKVN